ncbi:DUF6377 domain-containing protein [Fulvitalea axinellae]
MRGKIIKYASIFLLCLISFGGFCQNSKNYLKELDQELNKRQEYVKIREQRINALKEVLAQTHDHKSRRPLLHQLYKAYAPFQIDSAYHYAKISEKIATKIGDPDLIIDDRFQLVQAYTLMGAYTLAFDALREIRPLIRNKGQLSAYYLLQKNLYGNLADYQYPNAVRNEYLVIKNRYLDSLVRSETHIHPLQKAEQLMVEKRYLNVVHTLLPYLDSLSLNNREYAFFSYTIAKAYQRLDNREMQIKYLALSAIADIRSAIKENVALRELALRLYMDGDIRKAYSYIQIALDDAVYSQAKLRTFEVWEILPLIGDAYQEAQRIRERNLLFFSIIATGLVAFLLVAVIMVRKQTGRLRYANKVIKDNNGRLKELNNELGQNKRHIEEVNNLLLAANQLQGEQIAHYLGLCSAYIAKIDNYRASLYRKAKSAPRDTLVDALKSKEIVDRELKQFYQNFDRAFLELYPDFVEALNALLKPEERITPKKDELLNTELRIFALIRIGISESAQIADFLRYSPNTIYNYRAKVKGKALASRKDFEAEVMKIGTID